MALRSGIGGDICKTLKIQKEKKYTCCFAPDMYECKTGSELNSLCQIKKVNDEIKREFKGNLSSGKAFLIRWTDNVKRPCLIGQSATPELLRVKLRKLRLNHGSCNKK